jgi:hypothetical protein
VKSLAGEPCRIQPGIEGELKVVSGGVPAAPKSLGDGVYELALAKGDEALLYAGDAVPEPVIAPLPAAAGEANAWGLKRPPSPAAQGQ